jgi:integrase
VRIFKKGSAWTYRFEGAKIGGKRKQYQKSGFSTRKDAEAAGAKAYNEYNNSGSVFSPSEISVSDFYDLCLKEYCEVNCKFSTILNYKAAIKNYIKPVVGKYALCSLSPSALQALINDLFNRGFARGTLGQIKGLLTGAPDYAVHPLCFIPHNPAKLIRLPNSRAIPKIPTRSKPRGTVEDEQIYELLREFPEESDYHVAIQVGYKAGLRCGETFALTWDDIDLAAGKLSVNHQVQLKEGKWTFELPKYNSVRTIDIDAELAGLLARVKRRQENNRQRHGETYMRLFLNDLNQVVREDTGREIFMVNVREDGKPLTPMAGGFIARIGKKRLGIANFCLHALRHTHATKLYAGGVPLLAIKARLGHCDLKTTEGYTHDSEELRNKTKVLLEKIFAKDA